MLTGCLLIQLFVAFPIYALVITLQWFRVGAIIAPNYVSRVYTGIVYGLITVVRKLVLWLILCVLLARNTTGPFCKHVSTKLISVMRKLLKRLYMATVLTFGAKLIKLVFRGSHLVIVRLVGLQRLLILLMISGTCIRWPRRTFTLQTSNTDFKLQTPTSNFKHRLQTSNTDFKLQTSTSNFKHRLQTSNTDFKLQTSTSNFKHRLQTSNIDFKLQTSTSNFKHRLQTSNTDFKLQTPTSNFKH